MREILFRGKRTDNGEWIEGYYAGYGLICPNEPESTYNATGDYYGQTPYVGFVEVDPETVGRYTGKVVKTGKVFDGDIGKSIDGVFLVCWDDEKAAFVMRFNEYPYETLYLEEMWDDAEIIGNIHDNPELMEVR